MTRAAAAPHGAKHGLAPPRATATTAAATPSTPFGPVNIAEGEDLWRYERTQLACKLHLKVVPSRSRRAFVTSNSKAKKRPWRTLAASLAAAAAAAVVAALGSSSLAGVAKAQSPEELGADSRTMLRYNEHLTLVPWGGVLG